MIYIVISCQRTRNQRNRQRLLAEDVLCANPVFCMPPFTITTSLLHAWSTSLARRNAGLDYPGNPIDQWQSADQWHQIPKKKNIGYVCGLLTLMWSKHWGSKKGLRDLSNLLKIFIWPWKLKTSPFLRGLYVSALFLTYLSSHTYSKHAMACLRLKVMIWCRLRCYTLLA